MEKKLLSLEFFSKLFKKQFVQVEINFDNWKNIPVETSGTNLPDPINTFKDIGLGKYNVLCTFQRMYQAEQIVFNISKLTNN